MITDSHGTGHWFNPGIAHQIPDKVEYLALQESKPGLFRDGVQPSFIPTAVQAISACLLLFFPAIAAASTSAGTTLNLTTAPVGYAASIATHMWLNANTFSIPITPG